MSGFVSGHTSLPTNRPGEAQSNATAKGRQREPIAIVGIGCRFPGGVTDPRSLWELLSRGGDAISEIPPDRFDLDTYYDPRPATPGKVMTRWGGFLDGIDRFDARFFGISPREAERMDPQQRLLLEVTWEALEDGGQVPDRLVGSQTGVFIGMWLTDYELRLFNDPSRADFYMTTGSGRYTASGRLSYAFGLQGPSLTLDTACSSSLVAAHLACRSIWSGECDLAIAGGANVILQPHITIAYSQSRMMSPDGRCKFGDARANGYVRSDGAAVVVLKLLSRALADGDPIYALIRGGAVNNDGRSSGFLATPGSEGQEAMLRAAYRDAGVDPGRVAYIEAHGTGTLAGDPVELQAIGSVVGAGRPANRPCIVGSLKTNMGHTEGAAGVAGLIKVALALRNREIPASLHFETPNPAIPWDTLPLVIRPEATPWPIDADLIGGVSSFGIAGTNAHLVLEAAPAAAASRENGQANRPRAYLLPLSARTPGALADQARRFANFLEASSEDPALEDVCYTAATRRAHHEHRLGVVGRTRDEVIAGLEGYVRGEQGTGTKIGQAETERRPRVVFVFPGQGSQWLGMGRQLLAEEPVFRASIEACERAMAAEVDWSLVEQLSAEADVSRMGEIDVIQPSLFAIQVSLAALWRSRGVEPDAVVGHSMGETAAAHVAGVLSLDDAVKVICRRSRLLRRISGQGAMAVVDLPLDAAGQELIGYEDRLAVAVSNSPRSTVLSGDPAALDAVLAGLEQRNIFCRRVKVDVASHSPQVDPLRDDLLAALADLQPRHATVPFYSTVTGEQTAGDGCDATYWMRNLRQPVLFSTVVSLLLDAEHDTFIEMSPHPILLQAVEGTAAVNGRPVHALGSGQREADEPAVLLSSLGALYTRGYPVNWQALYSDGGSVTRLPTYAWQTERYWLDMGTPRAGDGAGQLDHHPLLGMRLPDLAHAPGHTVWQRSLDGGFLRKLTGGPPVDEMTTLPDAPIQSLALAAAIERFGDRPHAVANLEMHEPLLLDTDAGRTLQFVLTSDTRGAATFRAYSRGGPDEAWTCHATAALALERANADWLYSLTWRRQPHLSISGNGHATAAGYWLVFADQGSIGENVAAQLTQHGDSVVRVRPGSGFSIAGGTDLPTVTLDPNRRASYDQLFANLAATRGTNCRGVLYLWGLDLPAADHLTSAALGARVDEANRRALFLIQALADARWPTAPRCWVVTRGAQAPEVESDGPPPVAIAQTPLWGLGRVAALEHPEIWGGLIDLATSPTQNEVADLLVELTDPDGEDQIALRGGERFVARLIRTPGLERPKPTAASVSPDATYLVTGGLGDIGLHVAHWLVDQGARHLVLTGRSGLPDREMWGSVEADSTVGRRIAAVRALEERGVTVITPRVDTSDAEGMATLLASLRAGPWPLRGIFHAAGVLSNQAIVDLTPDALSDILRPKVDGAWLLHELTSDPGHPDALDFFVMFSSGAALWGSRGLAHYAAANAFLDGLAHERHTRGLPALSVNWGWWLGNGIAAGELADAFSAVGLDPMPADDALAALSYLLRVGAVQQSVAQIDWTRFRPVYESRRESPLLREIEAAPRAAGTGTDAPSQRSALLEQIERALPIERLTLITSHVRQSVAQVLGFGPDEPLDPRQGFFKLGMDSIMTVQLRSLLEGSLGQSLPATVAFEYPTVESLAAYLDREVLAAAAPSSGEPAAGAAAVEEFTIEESTDAFDDLSEAELLAAFDREFGSIGQDDPVTR